MKLPLALINDSQPLTNVKKNFILDIEVTLDSLRTKN